MAEAAYRIKIVTEVANQVKAMIIGYLNRKSLFPPIIYILILSLVVSTSCTGPSPTSTLPAQGKTTVVNSTADSGAGTLRQALLDVQSGDTPLRPLSLHRAPQPLSILAMNCRD